MRKPPSNELTPEELIKAMGIDPEDAKKTDHTFSLATVLSACYIALVNIAQAVAANVTIHDRWYNVGMGVDLNIWLDNPIDEGKDNFAPRYAARIHPVDTSTGWVNTEGTTLKIL
jgi:hypothetical protein